MVKFAYYKGQQVLILAGLTRKETKAAVRDN